MIFQEVEIVILIKKSNNLTSLSDFVDKEYGVKGTKKREKFETEYEAFKLGVLIQQARQEKVKRIFILLVLAISLSCCKEKYSGEPLGIRNNSDSRIYYWFSYWKNDNFTLYHYPDTILPEEKPINISSIAPHNITGTGESDPNWKGIFEELNGKKFSIYFFTHNPESQSEWDSIRKNYKLYRKDFNYQELVNNNYLINYP